MQVLIILAGLMSHLPCLYQSFRYGLVNLGNLLNWQRICPEPMFYCRKGWVIFSNFGRCYATIWYLSRCCGIFLYLAVGLVSVCGHMCVCVCVGVTSACAAQPWYLCGCIYTQYRPPLRGLHAINTPWITYRFAMTRWITFNMQAGTDRKQRSKTHTFSPQFIIHVWR